MDIVQQKKPKIKRKLKIDPEFRDKIPPLTDAEYEQLKENILRDGVVYEPIIVWNDTIIDGHHRWRIICEHWDELQDKFSIKDMDFPDKWAAIDWMCGKQLGRRNLTDEQQTYLRGKMYTARKKSLGASDGFRGNQYKSVVKGQSDQLPKSGSTAEAIAHELGVSEATVRRSERFSRGVDALEAVSREAAQKVLQGASGVAQREIIGARSADKTTLKELAEDILSGKTKEKRKQKQKPAKDAPGPETPQDDGPYIAKSPEEDKAILKKVIDEMYDPTPPVYTINHFLGEMEGNGAEYVSLLRHTVAERSELLTPENRPIVADAIHSIVSRIQEIERLVREG